MSATDLFTLATITFQVVYGFFVIAHDSRRILHFNLTALPCALWITHSLREAFPFVAGGARYLILDSNTKYGLEVQATVPRHGNGIVAHVLAQSVAERCG